MIFIFDFLSSSENTQEKLVNTLVILSIISIFGLALTIFAIIMWIKKDRLLKRIAKDKVNEVIALEVNQHLEGNPTLEEIKKIILEQEIWKNKEVHIEEVKTGSVKEISQQRIIKITVEDKNEPTGFRSFFVKVTPTWLIGFIHERQEAHRKRKKKK